MWRVTTLGGNIMKIASMLSKEANYQNKVNTYTGGMLRLIQILPRKVFKKSPKSIRPPQQHFIPIKES